MIFAVRRRLLRLFDFPAHFSRIFCARTYVFFVSVVVFTADQGEHVDVPGLPPHPGARDSDAGSLVNAGTAVRGPF